MWLSDFPRTVYWRGFLLPQCGFGFLLKTICLYIWELIYGLPVSARLMMEVKEKPTAMVSHTVTHSCLWNINYCEIAPAHIHITSILFLIGCIFKRDRSKRNSLFFLFSLEDMLTDFQGEGKGGKERERQMHMREKHRLVTSHARPSQGPNLQPGYVPSWVSNARPFSLQDSAQPMSHTAEG